MSCMLKPPASSVRGERCSFHQAEGLGLLVCLGSYHGSVVEPGCGSLHCGCGTRAATAILCCFLLWAELLRMGCWHRTSCLMNRGSGGQAGCGGLVAAECGSVPGRVGGAGITGTGGGSTGQSYPACSWGHERGPVSAEKGPQWQGFYRSMRKPARFSEVFCSEGDHQHLENFPVEF